MTGRRVQLYWNFNRKVWSIRDPGTRRVTGWTTSCLLENCTLRVSEAGRQRVLRERRKNVHAYIEGDISLKVNDGERPMARLRYNPYETECFVDKDTGRRVDTATAVRFNFDGTAEFER